MSFPVRTGITIVLLFFIGVPIQAHARTTAKKRVSIFIPAGKLADAIRIVEQQCEIPFAYERTMMDRYAVKQQQFTNQKLSIVLKTLLQGTELIFEQRDSTILIKKNQPQGDAPPGTPSLKKRTISGYVEDALSSERLIGVLLSIPGTDTGTVTNNYGFYSITLPDTQTHIRVYSMGYTAHDTLLRLREADTRIIFKLTPATNALEHIIVKADRDAAIRHVQMGRISLSPRDIQATPRFLGESDVMKTLQLLPGVQQGSEGTSALLVRGGSPDQNLTLLDGATLYSPSHLLGIFSTFNTSTIKNVDLYKGAFPARFGGRTSSVLEIATRDGDLTKLHGDFSIGILASQLTLEGPLFRKKTSFVLSGRRTYTDLLLNPLIKNTDAGINKLVLFFYDLNFKVQHRFSDNDRLFLSVYSGKDKFRIRTTEEGVPSYKSMLDMQLSWTNFNSSLRWNHVFSKNMFANTTLVVSDYSFKMSNAFEETANNTLSRQKAVLHSGIRDYSVKVDFDYRPHPGHNIHTGAGINRHTFTPGIMTEVFNQTNQPTASKKSSNSIINGTEFDLYGEDNRAVSHKLNINYGLHWSGFITDGTGYQYLQPRISTRYLLPADWTLQASYTRMAQYLHLLSSNSVTLPTDLWVPVTRNISPQVSDQFALGISRPFLKQTIDFSAELYYKYMDHVIEYKEGESYVTSADKNWSDKVAAGTGKAFGLEVMFQKKKGRLTGWVAYTLSRTDRQIPGINNGNVYPYKYDRRHDLKVIAVYTPVRGIEVSSSWIFQSAAPFTIPTGQYEGITIDDEFGNPKTVIPNITGRNNMRLAPYHRMDISISFIRHKKNNTIRTWNVSVYNVYNRKNPFLYYTKPDNNNMTQLIQLTLLPVMPSISYNLKF